MTFTDWTDRINQAPKYELEKLEQEVIQDYGRGKLDYTHKNLLLEQIELRRK